MDIESHLSALERPYGDAYLSARQQILAVGENAIEPLVDAFRKGRIAGWVCFDLLLAIGPAGRQAALDSTRRDGQEGAQALMALGKLKEPPPEILPLMRDSLDHSDRANVLGALSVLIDLHPKAETAFGDGGADEFLAMGPKLRALLDRPDPPIQEQAARALGLVRYSGGGTVQRLLELARSGERMMRSACTSALGAFGDDAAPALDWLRSEARRGMSEAVAALGNLGALAAPALDDLDTLRETYEGRTKGDTKSFRSGVLKATRAIRAAMKEQVASPKEPKAPKSRLVDLLERLEGRDDPVGTIGSTAELPSRKAVDEAGRVDDLGMLDEVEKLLAARQQLTRFKSLVRILAEVTRNAEADRGKQIFLRLLEENVHDGKRLVEVHWGLWRAEVGIAAEPLLDQLRRIAAGKLDADPYWILKFFANHPHPEATHLLGEMALRDPSFGSLVAIAFYGLAGNGYPDVREPLERMVGSPDIGYRKADDRQCRGYALLGLVRLADARSVPVLTAELEKRQGSTHPLCLRALAAIDAASATSAVLAGMTHALRELPRTGHPMPDDPYLIPAARYLARHLGGDDPRVAALMRDLNELRSRDLLPKAELKLLAD